MIGFGREITGDLDAALPRERQVTNLAPKLHRSSPERRGDVAGLEAAGGRCVKRDTWGVGSKT